MVTLPFYIVQSYRKHKLLPVIFVFFQICFDGTYSCITAAIRFLEPHPPRKQSAIPLASSFVFILANAPRLPPVPLLTCGGSVAFGRPSRIMPNMECAATSPWPPFRSFLRAPRGVTKCTFAYALAFPSGASFWFFALHHFIALLAMQCKLIFVGPRGASSKREER